MKIALPGTDVVVLKDNTIDAYKDYKKIHIIKLAFDYPTESKLEQVLDTYPQTNRFVVDSNVKYYNAFLKNTTKKYYVQNKRNSNIISFLKKNNKILFDFTMLSNQEYIFFTMESIFLDLIKNVEVILINPKFLDTLVANVLNDWLGNIILFNESYKI